MQNPKIRQPGVGTGDGHLSEESGNRWYGARPKKQGAAQVAVTRMTGEGDGSAESIGKMRALSGLERSVEGHAALLDCLKAD
jgi:hypothetical protein